MKLKNLLKRIVLLSIVTLVAYPTFSQENYLSGYVILSGGDTIHGYIDYRNWRINPDKISFKKELSDNNIIYTPLSCKGFSVQDEKYESGIISTELSPTNTSELNDNSELIIKTDTTFLQTIIQGKKSLYYFLNNSGKEQFYIKKDTAFELLVYKKYLKSRNQGKIIIENKKYIGQLLIYLNDCPSIQSEINNLEYRRKSMQKLFHTYYECTKLTLDFEKKIEKVSTEFGVLAGFSFIPENNNSNASDKYHSEMSLNMTFGVSLNIILPRTQKRWSFYNELVFAPYNSDIHQVSYKEENVYTITDYKGKIMMLKMNNNIRYQYPFGKASAYAYFGVSNGIGTQRNDYQRTESVFHSIITIGEVYDYGNISIIEVGLNLGLGVYYKRFSFAAGLDSFYRYNFLLGYKL